MSTQIKHLDARVRQFLLDSITKSRRPRLSCINSIRSLWLLGDCFRRTDRTRACALPRAPRATILHGAFFIIFTYLPTGINIRSERDNYKDLLQGTSRSFINQLPTKWPTKKMITGNRANARQDRSAWLGGRDEEGSEVTTLRFGLVASIAQCQPLRQTS